MSHSNEPGFSEDYVNDRINDIKEDLGRHIRGLENGLAQADEEIVKLEAECNARAVALLGLATDHSEAVTLLQRCRNDLAHFPVSACDEHLQREIWDYLRRLNERLSGPQKAK